MLSFGECARRAALWIVVSIAITGCPTPVVQPPREVDRPSEAVERLIDDALEAWVQAHLQPDRGDRYRQEMSRAIDRLRQATAPGTPRNGLARALLAKMVYEADGAAGIQEALGLATAACAEDKGFAPAFILRAQLILARRQTDLTERALLDADASLAGGFDAIVWIERGGRITGPSPPPDEFYASVLDPVKEMAERLRLIDRYLAFEIGNESAIPPELAAQLGLGRRPSAATLAVPGTGTIGKLKARHRIAKLSLELARLDFEGQQATPPRLAEYRRAIDDTLRRLDPDCFAAKFEMLKVQYRLASLPVTRTDATWQEAFDLARSILELEGELVRNEPYVRVIAFTVIAGYAEYRMSRVLTPDEYTREATTRKALYEWVDVLSDEYIGPPGDLVEDNWLVALPLLEARIGYDLQRTEFFAGQAKTDPAMRPHFHGYRQLVEAHLFDLDDLYSSADPDARVAIDATRAKLRARLERVVALAKST
jgi:hypothetical protein